MASRLRQSAAAPRVSNDPRIPLAELPPYERPLHPLNPKAQRALSALKTHYPTKRIDDRLTDVIEKITNCAGDINDRLTQKTESVEKRKAKRDRDGIEDSDLTEQEQESLAQMADTVQKLTERMDTKLRKVIDDRAAIEHVNEALRSLQQNVEMHASQLSTTRIANTTRDEDEMLDASLPIASDAALNSTQSVIPPSLVDILKSSIQTKTDQYQSNSLYHRYAENSAYSDFRKIVHDAQYPGDEVPPLPAPTTWFPSTDGDGPAPGITAAAFGNSQSGRDGNVAAVDEDDDDIAVARERISTKCPITLLEFVEPATSQRCPHSFERSVIEELIRKSRPPTRMRSAASQWQPSVQCPVPGCEEFLGLADLKTDPVLVRRIKRIQAARERTANRVADGASSDAEQVAESVRSDTADDEDGDDIDAVHRRQPTPKVKEEIIRARSQMSLDGDSDEE